jgi:hypothetical protein
LTPRGPIGFYFKLHRAHISRRSKKYETYIKEVVNRLTTLKYNNRMSPSKPLEHTFKQHKCLWFLVLVSGLSFGFTLAFAAALSSLTGKFSETISSAFSPSVTLIVLRIFSEATSILLGLVITSTLDVILWTAACRKKGLAMSTLLSLTSSTRVLGLFELLRWKSVGRHRLSVIMRFVAGHYY